MKITFYINFDLNLRGDYKGFYRWLDKNKAEERGSNYALIKDYEFPDVEIEGIDNLVEKNRSFADYLRKEIKEFMKIEQSDRIYVTFKVIDRDSIGGLFLFGKRLSSPWEGTYTEDNEEDVNFDL